MPVVALEPANAFSIRFIPLFLFSIEEDVNLQRLFPGISKLSHLAGKSLHGRFQLPTMHVLFKIIEFVDSIECIDYEDHTERIPGSPS